MRTASGSWRSDDQILTDCGVGQMAVFCRCSDTFDLPRTPGGWQLSTSASAPLPKLLIQSLDENEIHREKPGIHKLASCFARLLEFSKQSVFLEVQGVVCGRGFGSCQRCAWVECGIGISDPSNRRLRARTDPEQKRPACLRTWDPPKMTQLEGGSSVGLRVRRRRRGLPRFP
jgi:hypothetical protein